MFTYLLWLNENLSCCFSYTNCLHFNISNVFCYYYLVTLKVAADVLSMKISQIHTWEIYFLGPTPSQKSLYQLLRSYFLIHCISRDTCLIKGYNFKDYWMVLEMCNRCWAELALQPRVHDHRVKTSGIL